MVRVRERLVAIGGARSGAALLALAAIAWVHPAQAWRGYGPGWGPGWGGGVFFGFAPPPVYVGPPPVYYAPPYYPPTYYPAPYPPAPVYPPASYPAPAATRGCYAGPYVCPLETPVALGQSCSCPAGNGRILGQAG